MTETKRAALYFAILTGLFFAPAWVSGKVYMASDFLYRTPAWYNPEVELQNFDLFDAIIFYYPDSEYLNASLKHGQFPYWNPYNLGGRPIAFNGQSGYFYPPRLVLHRILTPIQAVMAILVLHVFLAGLFMYLYGGQVGLSEPAKYFVGTVWMFNGWSLSWFLMEFATIFSALIPLGLIAFQMACRCWRGVAFLGGAVGLYLVAGNLQFAYNSLIITMIVGCCHLFSQPNQPWLRSLLRVFSGLALGVLLAGPMLLPTVISMFGSQRPVLTLEFLQTIYREFLGTALVTFLFPDAFGNPADNFGLIRIPSGGNFIYPELSAYVGVATILLFGLGLLQRGFPRYLGVTGVVGFLIPATPLYGLVLWLPGFNRINSTRLVIVFMALVVLVAGFGFDAVTKRSRNTLTGVAAVLGLSWVGVLAYLNSGSVPSRVVGWLNAGRVRLPEAELYLSKQEHLQATLQAFEATYGWSSWAALAPLLWLALFSLALHLPRYSSAGLIGLVAADLICFGVRFNPLVLPDTIYPTRPTISFLQKHAGSDRVLGLGTFKPNTLAPFRLLDVGGYEPFYPEGSGQYLAYLRYGNFEAERQLPAQPFPLTDYRSPLVDLMGTRFLVAYPGQNLEGYRRVQESPLPIFENPHRLPRAFVVSDSLVMGQPGSALEGLASRKVDPRQTVVLSEAPEFQASPGASGTASIQDYQPHKVVVEVNSDGPAFLILTDAFAPGWAAFVDGTPSPILRAFVMFRAVPIKAGKHEVRFEYRPPRGQAGWGLFLLGTGLFLALASSRKDDQPL